MGVVHPIHVIATVNGRRRCIACIEIPRADPDSSTIMVISRILTLLKKNPRYVALDLAYADNISDDEWERNVDEECWAAKQERRPLPRRWRHVQTRLLNEKISKLKKECVEAEAPQFPFVQTCLYIGASTTGWHSSFLHELHTRRCNVPPDWGGKYMWEPGCTVIDITDHSYAMILPAQRSCGIARKGIYHSLRLRPLDGHDWLRGSGMESEGYPDGDRVWIEGEDGPALVTSIDAVHEVWPSFPPAPTSVDSDSDSDLGEVGDDMDATDYDDDDETKSKNEKAGEEKAPALKTEVKTEGSPELPEPETEQQIALTSRKRKRDAEPNEDEQRVWNIIDRLLDSYTPQSLGTLKKHNNYRPLLKRFMDKHPEHFAPKRPGAVPLILTAFIYPNTSIKDLER
ncbi:hypothetical protein FJTKL_06977 [Diaporthe vaccinii]|uniref:Uncharacterized protein n=1 Tax=Diaporthe vaccinii TaxID=105482 RepID=A0ABR4DQS2_9PEZI